MNMMSYGRQIASLILHIIILLKWIWRVDLYRGGWSAREQKKNSVGIKITRLDGFFKCRVARTSSEPTMQTLLCESESRLKRNALYTSRCCRVYT